MHSTDAMLKQVKATIGHDTHLDVRRWPIGIALRDGVVQLAGELPEIAAKKSALRAAAGLAGVATVVDGLRVGPPNGHGAAALRDAVCKRLLEIIDFRNCTLRAWVKGRPETLRDAGRDACGHIDVSADDGVVTLEGEVLSLSHRRLAGVAAWWAHGCRDVVNALAVVPPEDDNDDELVDALRLVLELDPTVHADRITATARDGVITLGGIVASAAERRRAEMDAWYLDGVIGVENRIDVR